MSWSGPGPGLGFGLPVVAPEGIFALCGSSARKVRRGAANLLGGRALRYELHGLTADELGDEFDLPRMLNHGYPAKDFVRRLWHGGLAA